MFFSYDGVKNVLHDVTFNVARGDKVAVIGYNGLGKTTLMRIIAGTRQPTAGKAVLGHNVVCGYLSQEFAETIPPDLTVYRNAKNAIPPGMNEKNFRNQLGAFGFDENDVEKPAGVLSGGNVPISSSSTSPPRTSISTGARSCRTPSRSTRARFCSFRTTSSSCAPSRRP